MDWLAKIKELIMGKSESQTPAQGKPWDVPQTEQGTPPGFHRMPDGSLMRDAAMAGSYGQSGAPQGGPGSTVEDAVKQAVLLQKQREIAQKFLPQELWNK